jgi:hypothetical protein
MESYKSTTNDIEINDFEQINMSLSDSPTEFHRTYYNDRGIYQSDELYFNELKDNGLIGNTKKQYIRHYINIDSKNRQNLSHKTKNFHLEKNILQIYKNELVIKINNRELLNELVEKESQISFENIVPQKNILYNNNLFQKNNNKIIIDNDIFDDYNGRIKISDIKGDVQHSLIFSDDINVQIEMSDEQNNTLVLSKTFDGVIQNILIISYDNSGIIFSKSSNISFIQDSLDDNFIEETNIYYFLIKFRNIYQLFLESQNIMNGDLILNFNSQIINYFNGVPINLINSIHYYDNGICINNYNFEQNIIQLQDKVLKYTENSKTNIMIEQELINGLDVCQINNKILTVERICGEDISVSLNNIFMDNQINLKYFGGSNIKLKLINQKKINHSKSNNYKYCLDKSYKDIVSVKMKSSIFPKNRFLIKNSYLYYQTLEHGEKTFRLLISNGEYTDNELEDVINNNQNIFKIVINSNRNEIKFISTIEISIRFDINNSINLGFPKIRTRFMKTIINNSDCINSLQCQKEDFNFNIFGEKYLLMKIIELPNLFYDGETYFTKINAKEVGNNNLNLSKNNCLYDTFVDLPLLLNKKIVELSTLTISFHDCNHELYDFGDYEHSFVLEIITLNQVPQNTELLGS